MIAHVNKEFRKNLTLPKNKFNAVSLYFTKIDLFFWFLIFKIEYSLRAGKNQFLHFQNTNIDHIEQITKK